MILLFEKYFFLVQAIFYRMLVILKLPLKRDILFIISAYLQCISYSFFVNSELSTA